MGKKQIYLEVHPAGSPNASTETKAQNALLIYSKHCLYIPQKEMKQLISNFSLKIMQKLSFLFNFQYLQILRTVETSEFMTRNESIFKDPRQKTERIDLSADDESYNFRKKVN